MATAARRAQCQVSNLGAGKRRGDTIDEQANELDESLGPLDESNCTISEDDEELDDAVADDIERFEASFKDITQRYRLINRIGEGTFSTVYKAEDLLYDHYQNDWDHQPNDVDCDSGPTAYGTNPRSSKSRYVAIKKIYVTSSPLRILNELELLHDLRSSINVCPLITAFRCQDQVIAVLPYFQHKDFRDYYRDFTPIEIKTYMFELLVAVRSVHAMDIIHRDIKPTNFLYSPHNQKGVLVDFGLAEREGTDYHHCYCCDKDDERQRKFASSVYATRIEAAAASGLPPPKPSYPKDDQRHSRRANRAGTRGFRAPEVLLKCTAQSCQIDIWSCGVILLTFLSKRFPFFHSADDIDAFIELGCIFGKKRMREVAILHGQVLETTIPSITENGHSWEKVLLWCTGRNKKGPNGEAAKLTAEEAEAVEFMKHMLELDPRERWAASELISDSYVDEVIASRESLAEGG